jgi:hypothetical protein
LVRRIGKSGCEVNSRVVAEFVISKAGWRMSEMRVDGDGAEQYGETTAGSSSELMDGLVRVS